MPVVVVVVRPAGLVVDVDSDLVVVLGYVCGRTADLASNDVDESCGGTAVDNSGTTSPPPLVEEDGADGGGFRLDDGSLRLAKNDDADDVVVVVVVDFFRCARRSACKACSDNS